MTNNNNANATAVSNPIPGVIYPPHDRLIRYLETGTLERATLIESLIHTFRSYPDNIALWTPSVTISYAELDQITDRVAAGLLAAGLQPLDRVLFQMRSRLEFYYCFLGCLKAGLIPICSLSAHREHEIGYLAVESHARAHIVDGDDPSFDFSAFGLKIQRQVPTLKHLITVHGDKVPGATSLEELVQGVDAETARMTVSKIDRDPFQVAVFQLSGGTTGTPKIIPRFQNDYLCNFKLSAELLGFRSDDTMFMGYPPIHNAAMGACWGPMLLSGGTVAIATELSGAEFARVLSGARPTWIGQLMSALTPYFKEAIKLGADLSSVRALWQAGPVEAAEEARKWTGKETWQMFGMTEGLFLYPRPGDPAEVWSSTLGRPLSDHDEIRILIPGTETVVPLGEVGEMVCRGPYTLNGYFNSPTRNAEAFTSDGFYRSGDLMSAHEIDGVIAYRYQGRIKDVINRGGEKINAGEVEGVLQRHPSIMQVAVFGVPCERLGERTCAVIVLEPGHDQFTLESLRMFLTEVGVAKFKWPEHLKFIENMPTTKVGKIDKGTLRERFSKELTM